MALPGWTFPFLAAMLGALFAARVWGQWSHRRAPHQLAWALGLTAYALASLVEAYVSTSPWSVALYRVYFPLAAINVGLLGLGSVLLARQGVGTALLAALLGLAAIFATLGPLMTPLAPDQPITIRGETRPLADWGTELGAKPFPYSHPGRMGFLALNVVGGLALVGGALLSWWKTRKPGVLLIGVGALLPFLGGTLSNLAGFDLRTALQLAGIAVMFLGYLKGQEAARRAGTSA